MSEFDLGFEVSPYRLRRKMEPDEDIFEVARETAEILVEHARTEERTDYLGIPHNDKRVPAAFRPVIPNTNINELDITNHTSGTQRQTTFHLHDRDRSGRIIRLEPQSTNNAFTITDTLTPVIRDLPFAIQKPAEMIDHKTVRYWLQQQLLGKESLRRHLGVEELADRLGSLARRQTLLRIGGVPLEEGNATVNAIEEKSGDVIPGGSNTATSFYTVWITGRFPEESLPPDIDAVTLRVLATFDGTDLLNPQNSIEYSIEAEGVVNVESMVVQSILQVAGQRDRILDRFKRIRTLLASVWT